MDRESVQATALKVVFDLLHVYGFEAFNITSSPPPDSEGGEAEGEDLSEREASKEEQDGGESDEETQGKETGITHKLLNIMASFLEGEVSTHLVQGGLWYRDTHSLHLVEHPASGCGWRGHL